VRKVLGLALGSGAYNYVFYLLLTWLPTYLSASLHIDLLHSFIYTSVPWLIATVTDLFIGGMLVDFMVRRGADSSRVRRIVLIGGTIFGLGIFGGTHPSNAAHALFWISLSIGGLAAAAPVMWSLPSLIASRPNVGKVGGIINFAGQISGICAPIITGYVVQTQHSYALAFLIPAVYLLIGIAGYVFLLGRIELAV
jgi:MFS family permease